MARLFALLPNLIHQMVAIVDQSGYRIRYLNKQGKRLLGFQSEDRPEGTDFTRFLPSRSMTQWLYEATTTAASNVVWRGSGTFLRNDATECPVEWLVTAAECKTSESPAFLVLARDLSASLELATSLEQEQLLVEAILDHSPDNIYFKDLGSRFIRVGRAMAKRMGFDNPDELIGKTDFDLFTAEHAQPAFDDEQRIIRTGTPVIGIEEKETFADGHVTWVSTSKMPLYDREGRVIGTFGISRDITEKKEAELKLAVTERELSEASRMAGMAEIASGVLHNISNALNSVNTTTILLLEQLGRSRIGNLGKAVHMLEAHREDLAAFLTSDPKGQQLPGYLVQLAPALVAENESLKKELEQMRRSIEHIKEIVGMQQSYARVSHLEEDLAAEEVFEEALRISEASLHRHGINVIRDYDPVPHVRAPRHKLLQILVNLIRNAKHSLDETGRVDKTLTVSIKQIHTGGVRFAVRDNGVGIAPENLANLFKFGFTTRKTGHGFGLHSSLNAAREMGGSLLAESDGLGAGAVFYLELPQIPGERT